MHDTPILTLADLAAVLLTFVAKTKKVHKAPPVASRVAKVCFTAVASCGKTYEGVPSGPDSGKPLADTNSRSMTDFLGTSDGLELVRAFMAVKDAKVRRRIVDLTKAAAAYEE